MTDEEILKTAKSSGLEPPETSGCLMWVATQDELLKLARACIAMGRNMGLESAKIEIIKHLDEDVALYALEAIGSLKTKDNETTNTGG